jgi:hypothetical protein
MGDPFRAPHLGHGDMDQAANLPVDRHIALRCECRDHSIETSNTPTDSAAVAGPVPVGDPQDQQPEG